jgi:hypothetical protein
MFRPSRTSEEGSLSGFELDFEPQAVDVHGTSFDLSCRLKRQRTTIDKTAKSALGFGVGIGAYWLALRCLTELGRRGATGADHFSGLP